MTREPWIGIRTFASQDHGRRVVGRICERLTAEMILLMDLVTSPAGIDELTASTPLAPEAVGDYLLFREFYGPHLESAMRVACGRVLQAVEVDADGRARMVEERIGKMPDIDLRASLAARLQWLVMEIPHQQEEYGQLYPDEESEALALCQKVDALDLADEKQLAEAEKQWPILEVWYKLSALGARICRSDVRAVEQAKEYIRKVEEHLKEREEEIVAERQMVEGELEPETAEDRQAALTAVKQELREARAREDKIRDAMRENGKRQRWLEGRRDQLIAVAS